MRFQSGDFYKTNGILQTFQEFKNVKLELQLEKGACPFLLHPDCIL